MAAEGNVETMLSGLDDATQRVLKAIFKYILKDIRFDRATPQGTATFAVSQNMGGGFFSATTPSSANREFAIAHGFGHPPYLLIPVLPLDVTNAAIVRLTVSRPADSSFVYLKSPETSQPVYVYLEG